MFCETRISYFLICFQAQKEADRVLQESLRTQGWGCSVNMSSTRKRDQEGHNVVPKMNEEDLQVQLPVLLCVLSNG